MTDDPFLLLPNETEVDFISFHPPYSAICSVGKAPFSGVMDILYSPGDFLLEFESFERWLESLAMQEFTIESLTDHVWRALWDALKPIDLSVVLHATTIKHSPAEVVISLFSSQYDDE